MTIKPLPTGLYFDTNILWQWPNCPNDVWIFLGLAESLSIELYLPQVVEDELESQFVRGAWDIIDDLKLKLKQLDKHCRNIVENDITGHFYSETDLRTAFRQSSDAVKQHYGIVTVPLTKMSLADILDMAINRIPPFEQIQIDDKKHGVVGLQDAAILFSIMEHLKPSDDRRIFLTADKIFYASEVSELIDKSGTQMECSKKISEIRKELDDHVSLAIKTPWAAEIIRVEADLNADKDRLCVQIDSLISLWTFRNRLWIRAKIQRDFTIDKFTFVFTSFPDRDHMPPRNMYSRTEGSKVSISATVAAEMHAYVDRSEWSIFGPQTDGPSDIPGLDNAILTEYLNVSLEGTVRSGVITDFKVTGVEPSKP